MFRGLFSQHTGTFFPLKLITSFFLNTCPSSLTWRFNSNNSSIASCKQPPCATLAKLLGYSFKKKKKEKKPGRAAPAATAIKQLVNGTFIHLWPLQISRRGQTPLRGKVAQQGSR